MQPSAEQELLACCAASYGHPLARWLLSDSMHPGGLALTEKLGAALALHSGSRLLDAGSGRGTSAVHLAEGIGCSVVGVTLEAEGAQAAAELAKERGVAERTSFLVGDIAAVGLGDRTFDAVLMECVLSIIPDKARALAVLHDVLRPGGRIGITDVTLSGPLPGELAGMLATVGCVGDARSLDEYAGLLEGAGFAIESHDALPETAGRTLRDISEKLFMAQLAAGLGKLAVDATLLAKAQSGLAEVRSLVAEGRLGYGLLVATAR